jgi:hypothetical protein
MSFYLDFLAAVQDSQEVLDTTFRDGAVSTIYYVLTLMQVQKEYTDAKTEAKTRAVIEGLLPGGGHAAMSGYYTGKYDMISSQGDAAKETWQNITQGAESNVSFDLDQQSQNLRLVEGLGGNLAAFRAMIGRGVA